MEPMGPAVSGHLPVRYRSPVENNMVARVILGMIRLGGRSEEVRK